MFIEINCINYYYYHYCYYSVAVVLSGLTFRNSTVWHPKEVPY